VTCGAEIAPPPVNLAALPQGGIFSGGALIDTGCRRR
jgi:hypothetical protein